MKNVSPEKCTKFDKQLICNLFSRNCEAFAQIENRKNIVFFAKDRRYTISWTMQWVHAIYIHITKQEPMKYTLVRKTCSGSDNIADLDIFHLYEDICEWTPSDVNQYQ